MPIWVKGKVYDKIYWNEDMFSIIVNAKIQDYTSGQFTKLSLLDQNDKRISRAYSFVNNPNEFLHEFLIKTIHDGQLTPKIHTLEIGDDIYIGNKSSGMFTPDNVPTSNNLWMLSTGTAVGVFLSILNDSLVWDKHDKITLVQGVRTQNDLSHQSIIQQLMIKYKGRFNFIPVFSQDQHYTNEMQGRITDHIANYMLSNQINVNFIPNDSQVMLCGNPNMIIDSKKILEDIGFTKCTGSSGNITFERYW
jgi:ferredoxin--NADP+ reductase